MKEFLMLIRENADYGQMSVDDMQADIQKHMEWVEELIAKGHFKGGNPLEGAGATISGNERLVKDGPFIESKECISGYYFLLASSLEEAVEIAKGCPALEIGANLEVREVIPTGGEEG
ncbi:MAG: hypothetical protein IPN73_17605 [Saprospiraceae bacterium]|nr:hypothetical protein [Saprospiraceae bacterium]MBK7788098.1 hypothetical protein [Saprospiraceae bacterium]MBK8851951.1 hypothetical protein [Saprospiraceae bacterium]MBL0082437.1 hypothetical protein [Saprospiraceae bacterium]